MINLNRSFPSFIKYMGSKTEILNFLEKGINEVHKEGQPICDLFSGSATLSGALRGAGVKVISNDIQEYSRILAETYLSHYEWDRYPSINRLVDIIEDRVQAFHTAFPQFVGVFEYHADMTLEEFNQVENQQRNLINSNEFTHFDFFYLFTKCYSGTYWSYNQCVWIDSIRYTAHMFRDERPLYVAILCSLMFAMAYNSQSTGHYAQYRDATDLQSMRDIMSYRQKDIRSFFIRKFNELRNTFTGIETDFEPMAVDYRECLANLEEGSLVYADPPYGVVHYSRFYHALETLVKYDHPEIFFKGRYRGDRHQSPFCIGSQVGPAFDEMFSIIRERRLELVLSYSNSTINTISFTELIRKTYVQLNNITDSEDLQNVDNFIQTFIEEFVTEQIEDIQQHSIESEYVIFSFSENDFHILNTQLLYDIKIMRAPHNHSTMGRKKDKNRLVNEILVIAERR